MFAWWSWLGAVVFACGAAVLGLIKHSKGTMGHGGVECGSVWFVHAYHSGCQAWLDGMSQVVFVFGALSVTLILAGLVHARRGSRIGMTLVVLAALAIAYLGPHVWHDAVFLNNGY